MGTQQHWNYTALVLVSNRAEQGRAAIPGFSVLGGCGGFLFGFFLKKALHCDYTNSFKTMNFMWKAWKEKIEILLY